MGDEAGSNHTAGVAAGKVAMLARSSIWKSAIVIAPLAATALFFASGTQAQTSGSVTPSASGPVAPVEIAAAARRKGPKIKEKTATDTSREANPTPTDPTTSAPVAPIDAPDAARRKGPKERDKVPTSRTESSAPNDAAARERRREGPKGDGESGRTEAPAPDAQPADRRKEGPKGAGESGRTATTPASADAPAEERRKEGPKGAEGSGRTAPPPAPDIQPTGRRKGPKGDGSHGRTATTPLIIGALSAAAILALVVSSGNDRPASP